MNRTQRVYDRAAGNFARVLDAGSGTGAMSRHIADHCPGSQLVMADLSTAMLDETTDGAASRIVADVQQLAFQDDSLDNASATVHQARFRGGLATEISLAKCCTVVTTGLDARVSQNRGDA